MTILDLSRFDWTHQELNLFIGTGSFEWKAALTGKIDVEHVHRLTAATEVEVKTGGKFAEFCIIPDDRPTSNPPTEDGEPKTSPLPTPNPSTPQPPQLPQPFPKAIPVPIEPDPRRPPQPPGPIPDG